MTVSTHKAKRIVKARLIELGLPSYKLTAKTVSFSDLARCSYVFVNVHGWTPDVRWSDLETIAADNGFCVQA